MLNIFRGLVLLLLCAASVAPAADTGWLTSPQNDHARIRFQAQREHGRIHGLLFVALAPGWKTYWRSPGEGGVAPRIVWQQGAQAEWFWPVPARFDISGLTTQGYHHQVIIPMTLTGSDDDVLQGTLTLSTCSNVCLLTDYPLRVDLNQPSDDGFAAAFEQAMQTVPAADGVSENLAAHLVDGNLVITGTTSGEWDTPEVYFDPLDGGILPGDPDIQHHGANLRVTVPVTDEWGDKPSTLAGKSLSLVVTNGDRAQQTTLRVGADGDPAEPALSASTEHAPGLGNMLLFALLGGLILNLMPCILPVLGMKLGAVLHAGADARQTRLHFLATSAGILTSFALLALLVTVLKLTGASLGWGIQFQNPWFIGLMVAVTFIFAMNLFGMFEMLLPSSATGRMATAGGTGTIGSFFEGVFATLLATPCSAPFLGTAVAFALAAPLPALWLIFFTLGLGMALPWLCVALLPGTARLLPRPGRWMNSVKMVLGLMMLASSLWLATLLSLHLGDAVSDMLVLALTAAALATFFVSRRTQSTPLSWLVIVALAGLGGYQSRGLLEGDAPRASPTQTARQIDWQPLSEDAIQRALADGKRVFVDISADWCVTCKVNEHRVLNQPDIIAALHQPDVVALRGDWSKPSAHIATFLQKRNRYAIPFTEVYHPGSPDGEVLPPLLDKQRVLHALNNAKG